MIDKKALGSRTAKGGFANEKAICDKFNNWKSDEDAQEWLKIMGYDLTKIKELYAYQIPYRSKKKDLNALKLSDDKLNEISKYKKTDVRIRIIICVESLIKFENLSLKKANSDANFNQVDKRKVDEYQKMWNFDDEISKWLKLFTGELNPKDCGMNKLKERGRVLISEMPDEVKRKIINFFLTNKSKIVSDILKGRGELSASWMLVTKYDKNENTTTWTLKDINSAIKFFGYGEVLVSPRGSLYIGRITMQRKGGTPDPQKLQFKIKPCDLFNYDEGK
ncbi:MAG: type II restriction endonuclease [Ignavibacteria bacterium]|nr:type II restriction endonuclease [Ignavibacteria bacterium]